MGTASAISRSDEIRRLDPRDRHGHQRIVHLIACYEFPWDMTRSLELALFRTFCVPRIAQLLDRTAEFLNRPQKRYDDTDLIVSTLMEHGYESEPGRVALANMNRQHGRFQIPNEDFLYVLSTFIFEPIRWVDRFGWRTMTENERMALFCFWLQVGRRMGIDDLPDDTEQGYAEFERFNTTTEQTRFQYDPANHRIAVVLMDMFASWFPRPLHRLVHASIRALMNDSLIAGFGLEPPPGPVRVMTLGTLKLRGLVVRCLPKRRKPRLRTQMKHRTYPQGYSLAQLGPPADHAPPPRNRNSA